MRGKKRYLQIAAFLSTYIAYTSFHASRTSWSNVEIDLDKNTTINKEFSGVIDSIFLVFYCLGMYVMGWVGDQVNLKYFLICGYIASTVCYGAIGLMGILGYAERFVYLFFFALNGVAQSIGWPASVAALGNWLEKDIRGLVMSLWSTSTNVGNIIGQQFGVIYGSENDIWYKVVIISTVYMIITSFFVLVFLKPYPEDMGIQILSVKSSGSGFASQMGPSLRMEVGVAEENYLHQHPDTLDNTFDNVENLTSRRSIRNVNEESNSPDNIDRVFEAINPELKTETKRKGIGFIGALKIPGVLMYCVIYAASKAVAYGILFGFKSQVQKSIVDDPVMAARITQYGDISQLVGGVALGFISDRMQARAILGPFVLAIASVFMFSMTLTQHDVALFTWMYVGFGVFFGGPYLLIATAIATDLAKNKSILGNEKALSTISGIIDASGSFGAVIMSLIVPHFDANECFYCFSALTAVVALLFIPPAYRDWVDIQKRRSRRKLKKDREEAEHKRKLLDNIAP